MKPPLFGVNVTGSVRAGDVGAGTPVGPVMDAQTAERLGFDFISISDHPGVADPTYETWTLLTWIAANTERIAVMPRVLGVPLRIPALVAKSAESLDRIAGGRLILGLGAGYDDSELASLGVPTLTPAEKLRGLSDATQIIRGMWREAEFTHNGSRYGTDHARLEPKPAHSIPIWFGTFGPHALRLTGRLADGWIPSRGYVPDEDLPVMRDRVLGSAEAAGRDPASIVCALNLQIAVESTRHASDDPLIGPPSHLVGELERWLDRGFQAFNFGVDEARRADQVDRLAAIVPEIIRAFGR